MKKIFISIVVLLFVAGGSYAQISPTDSLANLLAQRMKDSLGLTNDQTSQVYNLNTTLSSREANLRKQFTGSRSLPSYLKLLGEQRDSLYKNALPNDKYQLYILKKQNIIPGN
jgi:hypothetical protein